MRSRSGRYLLALVLPSALLCLVFVFSLYNEEQDRARETIAAGERLRLAAGVRALNGDLAGLAGDVRFLASLPSLSAAMNGADEASIARLSGDLRAFSASRRIYDQVRWIDETGMERVRVDFAQNEALVLPFDRLQDKGQRYYFTAAMQLGRDEVYVSPLDLNVEQGRVETPFKPMIRVAQRVWDDDGNPRGIVVVNFFGSHLLDTFVTVVQSGGMVFPVSLLNRDGYWLKGQHPADEWGFMFGRKESFATRHAVAWERIAGGQRGQFEDESGLWSFETVHPRLAGTLPLSAVQVEAAGHPPDADDQVWKIVSHVPAQAMRAQGARNLGGWLLITLLFLGALTAGCVVLARANQRRDAMAENLRALNRKLEDKVSQRTEELRQQAIRDPLTGLFNRRYLDETLPREVHRALRDNMPLAVVMIDLDHFKRFNDEWGHEAGDAVLLGAAELLLDGLRASDIACRFGGEELLVVMPGADTAEAVRRITAIAGEMRKLATRVMGRELPPITFSAGVAIVPDHGGEAETVVRAADRAMYLAKETGRDRVVVARPPGSVE
jgi:diguanylate cyclase (GGDEF)-like protein